MDARLAAAVRSVTGLVLALAVVALLLDTAWLALDRLTAHLRRESVREAANELEVLLARGERMAEPGQRSAELAAQVLSACAWGESVSAALRGAPPGTVAVYRFDARGNRQLYDGCATDQRVASERVLAALLALRRQRDRDLTARERALAAGLLGDAAALPQLAGLPGAMCDLAPLGVARRAGWYPLIRSGSRSGAPGGRRRRVVGHLLVVCQTGAWSTGWLARRGAARLRQRLQGSFRVGLLHRGRDRAAWRLIGDAIRRVRVWRGRRLLATVDLDPDWRLVISRPLPLPPAWVAPARLAVASAGAAALALLLAGWVCCRRQSVPIRAQLIAIFVAAAVLGIAGIGVFAFLRLEQRQASLVAAEQRRGHDLLRRIEGGFAAWCRTLQRTVRARLAQADAGPAVGPVQRDGRDGRPVVPPPGSGAPLAPPDGNPAGVHPSRQGEPAGPRSFGGPGDVSLEMLRELQPGVSPFLAVAIDAAGCLRGRLWQPAASTIPRSPALLEAFLAHEGRNLLSLLGGGGPVHDPGRRELALAEHLYYLQVALRQLEDGRRKDFFDEAVVQLTTLWAAPDGSPLRVMALCDPRRMQQVYLRRALVRAAGPGDRIFALPRSPDLALPPVPVRGARLPIAGQLRDRLRATGAPISDLIQHRDRRFTVAALPAGALPDYDLVIFRDHAPIAAEGFRFARGLVGVALLLLANALVLAWQLANRLLGPLREIERGVADLAALRRSGALWPAGDAELVAIIGGVDRILDDLEEMAVTRAVQERLLPDGPLQAGRWRMHGWLKRRGLTVDALFDYLVLPDGAGAALAVTVAADGISATLWLASVRVAWRLAVQEVAAAAAAQRPGAGPSVPGPASAGHQAEAVWRRMNALVSQRSAAPPVVGWTVWLPGAGVGDEAPAGCERDGRAAQAGPSVGRLWLAGTTAPPPLVSHGEAGRTSSRPLALEVAATEGVALAVGERLVLRTAAPRSAAPLALVAIRRESSPTSGERAPLPVHRRGDG